MTFDIASLAARLAPTIVASLGSDSAEVKALAIAEAEKLAEAMARIGGLLLQNQITRDEAAALIRVQAAASGTVLASLAEISRRAARRAVNMGLKDAIGLIDQIVGAATIGRPMQGSS